MKTKNEVRQEFLSKFQALLNEYDAEIEADDYYPGYPECGEDIRMVVTIPCLFKNNELVREGVEIQLGKHVWPQS